MINLDEIFMQKKEDEKNVRFTQDKVSALSRTRCPVKAGHAVRLKQD